jgi:hypothetical protein
MDFLSHFSRWCPKKQAHQSLKSKKQQKTAQKKAKLAEDAAKENICVNTATRD